MKSLPYRTPPRNSPQDFAKPELTEPYEYNFLTLLYRTATNNTSLDKTTQHPMNIIPYLRKQYPTKHHSTLPRNTLLNMIQEQPQRKLCKEVSRKGRPRNQRDKVRLYKFKLPRLRPVNVKIIKTDKGWSPA